MMIKIAATMLLLVSTPVWAETGDSMSGFFYRLATLTDNTTNAVFTFLFLVGLASVIAAASMFAYASKVNTPKRAAMALGMVGFVLCSPRSCMTMNTKTLLNHDTVQTFNIIDNKDFIQPNQEL